MEYISDRRIQTIFDYKFHFIIYKINSIKFYLIFVLYTPMRNFFNFKLFQTINAYMLSE